MTDLINEFITRLFVEHPVALPRSAKKTQKRNNLDCLNLSVSLTLLNVTVFFFRQQGVFKKKNNCNLTGYAKLTKLIGTFL